MAGKDKEIEMSGTKGHSGPRCRNYDEERAINEILELSAANIKAYLKHPEVSLDKKALISSTFLSRRVSNKIEQKTTLELTNIGREILDKYKVNPTIVNANSEPILLGDKVIESPTIVTTIPKSTIDNVTTL